MALNLCSLQACDNLFDAAVDVVLDGGVENLPVGGGKVGGENRTGAGL